jgi:DNA repair protein RadC
MDIKKIPLLKQPREKLLHNGAGSLSDIELLAVILGKGTKTLPVMKLSEKILSIMDNKNATINSLLKVKGIGKAKATLLMAAIEFARRRIKPNGIVIKTAKDVLPLISHYAERKQECLICITLNGGNEVISVRLITIGLVNQTQIHPREVLSDAISDRATAIIIAHNHLSHNIFPSEEDKNVTRKIKSASNLLGIKLLDHIIFNQSEHYSFLENGCL